MLCVNSPLKTMDLCPCSPDVGDCNRCGKKYPLDTMSDKPPKYQPRGIPPGPLRNRLAPVVAAANTALASGNIPEAHRLGNAAVSYYNRATKDGIATNYTRRDVPTLRGGKTRRNGSRGGDIVSHLLTIRNQVKLYHWQTGSFARHKATDDLTATLDTNIDAFVESYMGRYGRPKVRGSIKLHNFSESAAKAFVAKETKYLSSELPRKIGKDDTDLLNLRDTILGDLTKVLYLFTLQ